MRWRRERRGAAPNERAELGAWLERGKLALEMATPEPSE